MNWVNWVRALFVCSVIAAPLALAACHTTEGVGKDVQSTGEAIEDAAD